MMRFFLKVFGVYCVNICFGNFYVNSFLKVLKCLIFGYGNVFLGCVLFYC